MGKLIIYLFCVQILAVIFIAPEYDIAKITNVLFLANFSAILTIAWMEKQNG